MTPDKSQHIIKGMRKDLSKSKFNKEFAFHNHNIRITAREDNTLLSVTNEKGTLHLRNLEGVYLGHAIINQDLIVFTKSETSDIPDIIYICSESSNLEEKELFRGDLGFSIDNPIEALGVYENENIQKVYWVDGINSPRVINIMASDESRLKWTNTSFDFIPEIELKDEIYIEPVSNSSMFTPGVIQYAFSYYNKYGQESNIFNVSPLCYLMHKDRGASPEETVKDLAFKIKISNLDTNFDYVRIYSIHRTSLNAVPTARRIIDLPITIPEKQIKIIETVSDYYVGSKNKLYVKNITSDQYELATRGYLSEKENETDTDVTRNIYPINPKSGYENFVIGDYINNEFIIEKEISNIGITQFQYVEKIRKRGNRVFWSYNLEPKSDYTDEYPKINITYYKENDSTPYIEYIDNGTLGEDIDPTQLLYIGGEDIIAGTITAKDNTLFLGNIELKQRAVDDDLKNTIKEAIVINTKYKPLEVENSNIELYSFNNLLLNNYSYYKSGEHYRLGVQLQYKNGKWSEPIFIKDYTIPLGRNAVTLADNSISITGIELALPKDIITSLKSKGFKKIRGLVVFPEEYERRIIAQGMLCPTVYNPKDREENNPYVQSSWFIRPNEPEEITYNEITGEERTDSFDFNNDSTNIENGAVVEFRHGKSLITGPNRGSEIQNEVEYKVDQNILTFHSPDIEFSEGVQDYNNVQMRIIGMINFTSNYGYIDIDTDSPPLVKDAIGFVNKKVINESTSSSLVSGLFYNDKKINEVDNEADTYYLVYPWQKTGSLNGDTSANSATNNRVQSAVLKTKKISNIKFSNLTYYFDAENFWDAVGGNSNESFANGIYDIKEFNSDQVQLIKLQEDKIGTDLNYFGNIDTLKTIDTAYSIYIGNGFLDALEPLENETFLDPVRIKYKSTKHLVFKLKDSIQNHVNILPTINNINKIEGTINENIPVESVDGTLVRYKIFNFWFDNELFEAFPDSADIGDLCLVSYDHDPTKPTLGKKTIAYQRTSINNGDINDWKVYTPEETSTLYYIIDKNKAEKYECNTLGTCIYKGIENLIVSEEEVISIKQDSISIGKDHLKYPYLFIAELYRDDNSISNAFGGNTEEAIKNNLWLPASKSYTLDEEVGEEKSESLNITLDYGDTRFQRYDCLKTYAFTPEDENQVVEIASFMCETRINLSGRYDKNIGSTHNLNINSTNFNLYNPVYSQKDNFFNYRILDSDIYKLNRFPNTVTWSKEKYLGEDTDTWTNITMANTLDLDGTKGKLNKLITINNKILAFQDKGIANILFNSRVQIPVSDGVPIEITNGKKVEGFVYIGDNIGCSNKYSIQITPSGVYFLDSESNGIYLLADGLKNISTEKGFDIWTKEVANDPSFKTFYDKNNKDVYFNTDTYSLCYSEKLGEFTSFYDYNGVQAMFNLGNSFYSFKKGINPNMTKVDRMFVGEYNKFFSEDEFKPYSITILSNDNPSEDKIFTNIEYRADAFDLDNKYLPDESFDHLKVWNEYQEGECDLEYNKYKPSSLKKKFRIWRADIPRDKNNKLDRMRNPWLFIKLEKSKPNNTKIELHDIQVQYFK